VYLNKGTGILQRKLHKPYSYKWKDRKEEVKEKGLVCDTFKHSAMVSQAHSEIHSV
jgi:hypothetical protein